MTINVGVIGVGGMGELFIKYFLESGRARVIAIADINENRLKEISSKYGIKRTFIDWTRLVAMPELDGVAICTPPKFHKEQTIVALENGKHVICEKPPAMNAKEAFEMARASNKYGREIVYGYQCRFSMHSRYIKELVEEGYLGDIYRIRVHYLRRSGAPRGWFRVKEMARGGPLIDCAIHYIDLAWWIAGKPRPVTAFSVTYNLLGNYEVEDTAIGIVTFSNKCNMIIEASWLQNWYNEHRIVLYGTKGGAQVFPQAEIHKRIGEYFTTIKPEIKDIDTQRAKVLHFLDVIEKGVEPIPSAEDGVVVMKIIDAIYESASKGTSVSIE